MNNYLMVLLILLSFGATAATDTGTEEDHRQLRELLTMAQTAVNNDQPSLLQSHLHKDYVITVMNQEVLTDGRTVEQLFYDWFKKPDAVLKSMHVEPQATIKTNIYEGKFGICHGTSTDTYELADGRTFAFDSKWTASMIKEGDDWKLVALHVGVDPINNPLIDGYRSGLGFGGVAIEINRLLFE
ncbi:DUF4440 domain-containing protein [Thiosocius teredinicola]|uniref:DUF4440 domain-containing protein n=1 Tax=Thiosocius teredinicola TaxID=1973002 RepID=UPI00099139D8